MANAAALVQESIWRDEDWRNLSRGAQALYMQLLSQKELDCAGILPLQVNKWAKGCNELNAEQVWADLNELRNARFVLYDTDTDEAFVRTYIRNSNVMKVPNMLKSARRCALLVGSPILRSALAGELRATGIAECEAVADQLEPVDNTVDNNCSRTVREQSGVGVGVGVGVTLVSTHLGEDPPSEFCVNHPQGTDKKCVPCGRARQSYPERKAAWDTARKQELKSLREKCPRCHGTSTYEDENGGVRPCNPHLEAS